MKVRSLVNLYEGRGLVKGKIYDVLSIEKDWYRICCEMDEDYLFPPEWFEIVTVSEDNHKTLKIDCTNEEIQNAVNRKFEHPDYTVFCPVCGKRIEYTAIGNSCIVRCQADNCIAVESRGI